MAPISRASRPGGAQNRAAKGGPSKLRGVIWHKSNGKWEARIYEAGKQRFLGYHTSEVAAARAYDKRAVELHGSAAKVNFPTEHEATRHSLPAPKPGCAPALQPTQGESQVACQHQTYSSLTIATARPGRRQSDADDEDYVPFHDSLGAGLPPLPRRLSARRLALTGSPAPRLESDEQSCDSDFEDEERLELGAVQVLASLRSSSSDDNGVWLGDLHRLAPESPPSSPPQSSTAASPAPARKSSVWEPPQLWQAPLAESAAPAHSSCLLTSREAADECVESRAAAPRLAGRKRHASEPEASFDGSCSDEERDAAALAGRKWAAPWDRQAKRQRRLGSSTYLLATPRAQEPAKPAPPQPRAGRGPQRGAKPSRGSSRFRGVSWCEKGQKWRALIWDGHRQHFLGHFKSEEEGARAYDRALLTRRKKDGTLNFPVAQYADFLASLPPGPPASAFLKPGQAPVCQDAEKPVTPEQPRPPPIPRPRRAAARALTAAQIDGELAADEDSAEDEAPAAAAAGALQRSRAAHGSSRFKGVSWSVRSGKWRAQMWLGAKVLHLGFFDDEREAARAYDAALREHKGLGAAGNFGDNGAEDGLGDGGDRADLAFVGGRWEARIFNGERQASLGLFPSEMTSTGGGDAATPHLRVPEAATNFVSPADGTPGTQEGGSLISWGTKKRRNS